MSTNNNCDNCSKNKATVICHACNAVLCQDCDNTIHKFGIFKNHTRNPIKEGSTAGFCDVHGSRFVAVCETCKETCCCDCLVEKHAGHDIIEYYAACQKKADNFKHLKSNLQTFCEIGKIIAGGARKEIEELDISKAKAIEEINASFAHAEALLAARKAEFIGKVTQTVEERNSSLQEICTALDEQIAVSEKLKKEAQEESSTETSQMAKSIEIEHVIKVVEEKVDSFVKDISFKIEKFSFNDKKTYESIFDPTKTSSDDKDEIMRKVLDNDKFFNSFGAITVSAKYDAQNSLVIPTVVDPVTKVSCQDIDDTSAQLSWSEGIPVVVKSLVDTYPNVFFVLESKNNPDPSSDKEYSEVYCGKETKYRCTNLEKGQNCTFRVRCCLKPDEKSDSTRDFWCSNALSFISGGFPGTWIEGPYYTLNEAHTIATKDKTKGSFYGLALGSRPIPQTGITKFRIVVTKYCGSTACVGVAPVGTDQSIRSPYENKGFYICTCDCELHSGEPYEYSHKSYISGKVSTGGYIDVIVNMDERTISFNCNGKKGGVAYKNIPVDKPLVPAAAFDEPTDAFELKQCPIEEN